MRWARGESLDVRVECEKYDVNGYAIDDMNQYGGFENVNTVQAAAAWDRDGNALTLFVINADLDEDQLLTVDVRGFEGVSFTQHTELYASSPDDRNTWEQPDRIVPVQASGTQCENGILLARIRKASWNVFRFE